MNIDDINDTDDNKALCKELLGKLEELELPYNVYYHDPVFTIDEWNIVFENNDNMTKNGVICINLFLKVKKKNKTLLVVARSDKRINLKEFGKLVGYPNKLRFADVEILEEQLKVRKGAVTPFALIHDVKNSCELFVDETLNDNNLIVYFHPLTNAGSVAIKWKDMLKFFEHINHEPKYFNNNETSNDQNNNNN
eukprot:TRINITY_DN9202_c0_g1_i1.p1 TRINITY_DN9202_c0_g1~~TRINITY_DN9202_c0_g1_i1.p1  ORF type:complete len:194 (-),score=52.80 TRINITY_DN9202_c0_g1_i1:20-601(-)